MQTRSGKDGLLQSVIIAKLVNLKSRDLFDCFRNQSSHSPNKEKRSMTSSPNCQKGGASGCHGYVKLKRTTERSWKTVHFSEQMTSADIFGPNEGYCLYFPQVSKVRVLKYFKDNKYNSLHLARKLALIICSLTLSLPQSSQAYSSYALGNLLKPLLGTNNVRGRISEFVI